MGVCSGFQLLLKSKYEANHKVVANSILVLNSQTSLKFIELNPKIQYTAFHSGPMLLYSCTHPDISTLMSHFLILQYR